jgi:S-disulfanyl-L-cysteine oxidoreductase SoxD
MGARARFVLVAGICAVAATAFAPSPARASAAPDAALVFTAEQAESGRAAFAKYCATCHMADLSGDNDVPQLAGANFMATWRRRSTKDLFDYMSGAMPPNGGSLPAGTYASIIAYILQSNGARAGDTPFDGSTAVTIESVATPAAGRSGK